MNIYIWGTGKIASRYLKTNELKMEDIKGFIETKRTKNEFCNKKVYEPCDMSSKEYDWIFVCVRGFCEEIYTIAEKVNLDVSKMIFIDNWQWLDGAAISSSWPNTLCKKMPCSYDERVLKEKFPRLYSEFVLESERNAKQIIATRRNAYDLIDEDSILKLPEYDIRGYKEDYTRYRTFELMANELIANDIEGAVAELGVYRGDFSSLINSKFKKRKMYLFDTFESFDEDEFQKEVEAGRCDKEFISIFKNTSIEIVMGKMKYPENIEIKKGYFPNSLNGLEEKFCFVSLDVDFEKSILEGLRYFYPRLSEGGIIFVHDYNNCFLEGVKVAVKTYESEINERLKKVPLCDRGGTLVICK